MASPQTKEDRDRFEKAYREWVKQGCPVGELVREYNSIVGNPLDKNLKIEYRSK